MSKYDSFVDVVEEIEDIIDNEEWVKFSYTRLDSYKMAVSIQVFDIENYSTTVMFKIEALTAMRPEDLAFIVIFKHKEYLYSIDRLENVCYNKEDKLPINCNEKRSMNMYNIYWDGVELKTKSAKDAVRTAFKLSKGGVGPGYAKEMLDAEHNLKEKGVCKIDNVLIGG